VVFTIRPRCSLILGRGFELAVPPRPARGATTFELHPGNAQEFAATTRCVARLGRALRSDADRFVPNSGIALRSRYDMVVTGERR